LLVSGRIAALGALVIVIVVYAWLLNRASKGKVPRIRKMAGFDAIEEAVGRATEMGKPVFFTPGISGFDHADSPQTIAGLTVLRHVAKLTARYKARLIAAVSKATVLPVAEETVRQGYLEAGRPEAYEPGMLRYLSDEQFAWAGGCIGIMHREGIATNIMVGNFMGESLLLAEAGYQAGAIQVAGTANRSQIGFFVTVADYCLIGEEIFAAGAYLFQDPVQLAGLGAQDVAKWIAIGAVALGIILNVLGIPVLVNLLKM